MVLYTLAASPVPVVAALAVAHLAGLVSRHYLGHDHVFGLVRLFDLDREHNVPLSSQPFALWRNHHDYTSSSLCTSQP